MKKQRKRCYWLLICTIMICIAGFTINETKTVAASEKKAKEQETERTWNADDGSLLEGMSIEGPDCVYALEDTVEFTLKKKNYPGKEIYGSDSEVDKVYRGFRYKWSSSNKSVAKFKRTLDVVPSNSCAQMSYPVLQRPNIFKIQPGKTIIKCVIKDGKGHSVTLTKELRVLKGTPIKSVKIGRHKLKKYQRRVTQSYIYSNERDKEIKIKVKPETGWTVQAIRVDRNQNGFYKNITDKKVFSLDTRWNVYVNILLKNQKTGQDFAYNCSIVRYTPHLFKIGTLQDGCALVSERTAWDVPMVPRRTVVLNYKKNAKKKSWYSFKSAKDLVRKLKKYYGYTNQTVKYKNGTIYYKETQILEPWTYCRSKQEKNRAVNQIKAQYPGI